MYIIGVDGGGSKCRARLHSIETGFISEGVSGPANPARNYDQAIHSIVDACNKAIGSSKKADLQLGDIHAGMGLAGVNVRSVEQRVLAWSHPFKTCHLTTDLHIACLGANNRQDGAVIIAGTGSSGLVIHRGKHTYLGGHGFPLGDYGAGSWMGLEAIRHTLCALDGLYEQSTLTRNILQHFRCHTADELVEKLHNATGSCYATAAPYVLDSAEQGTEEVSIRIVKEGAMKISLLARQLLDKNPDRLSMIGGVSERIKPWLARDIADQIEPALCSPDQGAIFFAENFLT